MPQKNRPSINDLFPDQLHAECNRQQAAQIIDYDHHAVKIEGRLGVMLTYHWMPLDESADPLILKIVFAHAEAHPLAPPEVQAVIDTLVFV